MSLILEALRKSEAERRRGQAPDLHAELPPVAAARRARWPRAAWIAIGATCAVLLAIAGWSMRGRPATGADALPEAALAIDRDDAPAVQANPRAVEQDPVVVATPSIGSPGTSLPILTTSSAPAPAVAPSIPVASSAEPTATPPAATTTRDATPTMAVRDDPPPAPPIATAVDAARVPTVGELPADVRKALPPLRLTMHVWNADPARRVVILDGTRLVEGDRIGEARIAEIAADGVLLDWNGRRLRLPLR